MSTPDFVRHTPQPPLPLKDWHPVLSHTHTYSGRADHGGTVRPPESYARLARWANHVGIAALGMGSPYTPETALQYDQWDGAERARYYASGFPHGDYRGDAEIASMLEAVNAHSRQEAADGDPTLFFLDNETPKGRYGHLWWVNYQLDYPAWHDYDQDFDRWMVHRTEAGQHDAEPMAYQRRPYREIMGAQRAGGALGMWAHPTSWWPGDRGQFITNLATEMPAHAWADGYLDGMVIMGYHAHRPEYQALWFALLDCGLRVPGVAEMDSGLSDAGLWAKGRAYLTLVPGADAPRSAPEVAAAWKTGNLIAGSGAWVHLNVDGTAMGQVLETSSATNHRVVISFGGECDLYNVDLVGSGGQILWQGQDLEAGTVELRVAGLAERGYVLARVQGLERQGSSRVDVYAVANPVYLHPRGTTFEAPLPTELNVELAPGSPWEGGSLQVEQADGTLLERALLRSSHLTLEAPAGGRVTLVSAAGQRETRYLINNNPVLLELQRYLYRGRFLRHQPDLKPGQVPVEHWKLDAHRQALLEVTWQL